MKKFSLFILAVFFAATSFSQELITIGTGTTAEENRGNVLGNLYGNERHAVLYTNAEISSATVSHVTSAQITKFAFNFERVNPPTARRSHKIYIKEIPETALTTAMFSDWAALTASATLVYSQQGTNAILSTGWNEFVLSTPFEYYGGNILVFTDNIANGTSGDGNSVSNRNLSTPNQPNMHWFARFDGSTPLDNSNSNATPNASGIDGYRANILLTMDNVVQTTCYPSPTNLIVSEIMTNSAKITFTSTASGYEYAIGASSLNVPNTLTPIPLPTNPYTISGLTSNTAYNVWVRNDCGAGNTSVWTFATFRTTPSCLPPTAVTVTNIGVDSATIKWHPSVYRETAWIVEYKKSTETWANAITVAAADSSKVLSLLNAGTVYNVRIRSYCSIGDTSAYTSIADFRTTFALPYRENFSATSIPPEYSQYRLWADSLFAGSPFTTSGTSWMITFASSLGLPGNHVKVNNYGSDRHEWLLTPTIYIGTTLSQLKFDLALTAIGTANVANMSGVDDRFIVAISVDGGATWADTNAYVWNNSGSSRVYNNIATTGQSVTIDLTNIAGIGTGVIQIGFYVESTIVNADNDLHIDNILVEEIPLCNYPSALTVSDLGAATAKISFNTTETVYQYVVGPRTATDPNTLTPITCSNPDVITGLTPTTQYKVWVRNNCSGVGNGYSAWTDSLVFTTTVICTPPVAINVTNITTSTADINWTASPNNEADWILEYKKSTQSWADSIEVISISTTAHLQNLDSNNVTYNVRIKSNCGGNGNSVYSNVLSFKTKCGVFSTLTEDFNSYTPDIGLIPDCWTKISTNGTYPTIVSSSGTELPSNSIKFQSSKPQYLATPKFNAPLSGLQVTFKLDREASNCAPLQVGVMSDPTDANTFVPVQTIDLAVYHQLVEQTVYFNTVVDNGANRYIAFRYGDVGSKEQSTSWYYWIDDVAVTAAPSCFPPVALTASDMTATSVKIDFTNTAATYQYAIGASTATNPNTLTPIAFTGNPYTITTGLLPNTAYKVWVRNICAAADTSIWSAAASFTTTPSCTPPTAISVTNITTNSANISWTPSVNNESTWRLEYKKSTDAWTNPAAVHILPITGVISMPLQGLDTATIYNVRMRSSCSATDSSVYTPIVNFTTAFMIPYLQDFSASSMPTEYSQYSLLASSLFSGTAFTTTGSSWVRISSSNGLPGNHVKINNFGVDTKNWLLTPPIYIGTTTARLKFDVALTAYGNSSTAYMTGADDRFIVAISTDGGTTWSAANSYTWDNVGSSRVYNNIATTGETITLNLTGITGVIKMGFYAESTIENADNDLHIDNIVVEEIPACEYPTALSAINITTTTAQIQFTTTAASTQYAIGSSSVTNPNGLAPLYCTTNPNLITGLVADRSYKVWVRNDCSATSDGFSAWIGPVTFTTVPSCFPPAALTLTGVTTNTATITWTPSTHNETEWILEYKKSSDAWTNPAAVSIVSAQTNPTANLSGLIGTTSYDVRIRSYCSVGDTSAYTSVFNFWTTCLSVPSLMEDFESTSINEIPRCWARISQDNSAPVIVSPDATHGVLSQAIKFFSNKPQYLITPKFDTPLSGLQLKFKLSKESTMCGLFQVGVMTDPADANTYVPVQTIDLGSTVNTMVEQTVYFNTITDNTVNRYIAFKFGDINGVNQPTGNYYWIDDVNIIPLPSCIAPIAVSSANITPHSVTINWTPSPNNETNWILEYKKSIDAWSTATAVLVSGAATKMLPNLDSSTIYNARLRSFCGGTDTSEYSTILNFTTAFTIPYLQDFSASSLPIEYSQYSLLASSLFSGTPFSTSSAFWNLTTLSNGLSGNHVKINNYGTDRKEWLITPPIYIGTATTRLKFDVALTAYNSGMAAQTNGVDDKFIVAISTDGGATWVDTNAYIWDNAGSSRVYNSIPRTKQTVTIGLTGITGTIKIGFYVESTVNNADNDLHIDSVIVEALVNPTVITEPADNITIFTATLHKTVTQGDETIIAEGFEYRKIGELTWTTSTTGNLSGLISNTHYEFRAYATTASGTTHGSTLLFTTLTATAPTVVTEAADNITTTTATLHKTVTAGDETITTEGFQYRIVGAATWIISTTGLLTNLTPDTDYEFSAYATTASTTTYGSTLTFKTTPVGLATINEDLIAIYPNPVRDELMIDNGQLTIKTAQIMDVTGKIVVSSSIINNSINVSQLSSGIYFIKIETDKGFVVKKFAKE